MERNPVGKLLLFGATGDLAKRMLLPSLYGLHADGLLPAGLTITGSARGDLDDEAFRAVTRKALDEFLPDDRKDEAALSSFLDRIFFQPVDLSDQSTFQALADKIGDVSGGLAIYLSTAPSLFEPAVKGLQSVGLAGDTVRIGLEKPLGYDLESSREINDTVASVFPEDRIFRIDHYLGKETVQNILALRFGNSMFEPIWNAQGIDNVQITIAETVGLEDRAGYYEGAGALRDMVANHMLQLVALIAMEPPALYDGTAIRDEKAKVFRSLRQISPDEVRQNTVTGQYEEGAVGGKVVRGYDDELGYDSGVETFVAIKAHIDNWRWQGVPFYLRTGKRMAKRRSEIAIQFKPVPHSMFSGRGGLLQPNTLIIRLQPEEYVQLLVMTKEPGLDREGLRLREVPLNLSLDAEFAGKRRRIAYERLLLDLIEDDQTLFVRRDEVEAQWKWIDAIRAGWTANQIKPKHYAAGTWGPAGAIALTERDNVTWQDD
ncbi:glucose-6-phosphate dehydrogenase [Sphingomonas sp. Leaf231]|uniref:glucose-6-phosphate dehydrogenase n=1 Tax=Sphingomonas sp. Leaf231 TaxID=1736301 RepID=UPI0006FD4025|nr:glucose-6-phosphate dehydrogenase [Sphingomonas sp. Leaf231]KQN94191.1 glucose-6-phosphate dehydrogenase [Sphingomonas sp. Leaf231]